MKKIAAVASVLFLLVSCVQSPATYQADPQMDAIVAGATQTAAGQRLNETAVAQESTRQVIIYQATQVAQQTRTSYEATVQAVQAQQATAAAIVASETAVAATATTQHQMGVNALIGEETRIALIALGTRQAISIQATATAVQRESDDDLARRERKRLWGNVALGGVTILLLALGGVLVWRAGRGGQAFFNDVGQLVAIERSLGGIVLLDARQRQTTVIEAPPINNMPQIPRPHAPREIPMTANGQRTTIAVDQDDDVKPETWRTLAIALLVHCANFSRSGVREHAAKPAWRWGDISQPEYNKAFQFMEKNGYLRAGKGTENTLTDRGYDWLSRWVPNSLTLTLPYPELTAVNEITR